MHTITPLRPRQQIDEVSLNAAPAPAGWVRWIAAADWWTQPEATPETAAAAGRRAPETHAVARPGQARPMHPAPAGAGAA